MKNRGEIEERKATKIAQKGSAVNEIAERDQMRMGITT